jgi:hypothetical protein
MLHYEVDAAHAEISSDSEAIIRDTAPDATASKVLVLTAEHSPECPYEFDRLRKFRCRENDPNQPALFVVYDSSTHDKSLCNAVFDISSSKLVASQRGR